MYTSWMRTAPRTLTAMVSRHGQPVTGVVESMNGARFVHDQLERWDWDVEVADAVKVKGLAPLAEKTDKIDAKVLAELARRDIVPGICLPDPSVREARDRARLRLHLVRHRVALEEPHPRHAHRLRAPGAGVGSVRHGRARAARAAGHPRSPGPRR